MIELLLKDTNLLSKLAKNKKTDSDVLEEEEQEEKTGIDHIHKRLKLNENGEIDYFGCSTAINQQNVSSEMLISGVRKILKKEGEQRQLLEIIDFSTFTVSSYKSFFSEVHNIAKEMTSHGFNYLNRKLIIFCYDNGPRQHKMIKEICDLKDADSLVEMRKRVIEDIKKGGHNIRGLCEVEVMLPNHKDFLDYLFAKGLLDPLKLEAMKVEGKVFGHVPKIPHGDNGEEEEDPTMEQDGLYNKKTYEDTLVNNLRKNIEEYQQQRNNDNADADSENHYTYTTYVVRRYYNYDSYLTTKERFFDIINPKILADELYAGDYSPDYVNKIVDFVMVFQPALLYITTQITNRMGDCFEILPNKSSTRILMLFWDRIRNPVKQDNKTIKDLERSKRRKSRNTDPQRRMMPFDVEKRVIEKLLPRPNFHVMARIISGPMYEIVSKALNCNEIFNMGVCDSEAELAMVHFLMMLVNRHLPCHLGVNRCKNLCFEHSQKEPGTMVVTTPKNPPWSDMVSLIHKRVRKSHLPMEINLYSHDTDVMCDILMCRDSFLDRQSVHHALTSLNESSSLFCKVAYNLILNGRQQNRNHMIRVDVKNLLREKHMWSGMGMVLMLLCGNDFSNGALCYSESSTKKLEYTLYEMSMFIESHCVCLHGWKRLRPMLLEVSATDEAEANLHCNWCSKPINPSFWKLKIVVAANGCLENTSRPLCNLDLLISFVMDRDIQERVIEIPEDGVLGEEKEEEEQVVIEDLNILNSTTNCLALLMLGSSNGVVFKSGWTPETCKLGDTDNQHKDLIEKLKYVSKYRHFHSIIGMPLNQNKGLQIQPPYSMCGGNEDDAFDDMTMFADNNFLADCDALEASANTTRKKKPTETSKGVIHKFYHHLVSDAISVAKAHQTPINRNKNNKHMALYYLIDTVMCIHRYIIGRNLISHDDNVPILHYTNNTMTIRVVLNDSIRKIMYAAHGENLKDFVTNQTRFRNGTDMVNETLKRFNPQPNEMCRNLNHFLCKVYGLRMAHQNLEGVLSTIFKCNTMVPSLTLWACDRQDGGDFST